ncbi:MAG: AAA family ATPase [Candidatus Omnitrophota bacterium]
MDDSIILIDPATGKELRRFGKDTGLDLKGPAGITFADGKLFVTNYDDHSLSVIDPATGKELDRFGLGTGLDLKRPAGITFADGKLFVTNYDDHSLSVIDPATGKELDRFGLGTGLGLAGPAGITFANGKLFITNHNNHSMSVIDPATGKELHRFEKDAGLGLISPLGIALVEGKLFVTNYGDNSISIIEFEDMISSKPQPPKDYTFQTVIQVPAGSPAVYMLSTALHNNNGLIGNIVRYLEDPSSDEKTKIFLSAVSGTVISKEKEYLNVLLDVVAKSSDAAKQYAASIINNALTLDKTLIEPLLDYFLAVTDKDLLNWIAKAFSDVPLSNEEFLLIFDRFRGAKDEHERSLALIIAGILHKNPGIKTTPEQLDMLLDVFRDTSDFYIRGYIVDTISAFLQHNAALALSSGNLTLLLSALSELGKKGKTIVEEVDMLDSLSEVIALSIANKPQQLNEFFTYFESLSKVDFSLLEEWFGVIGSIAVSNNPDLLKPLLIYYEQSKSPYRESMGGMFRLALQMYPELLDSMVDALIIASPEMRLVICDIINDSLKVFSSDNNKALFETFTASHLDVLYPLLYTETGEGTDKHYEHNVQVEVIIENVLTQNRALKPTERHAEVIIRALPELSSTQQATSAILLSKTILNNGDLVALLVQHIERSASDDIKKLLCWVVANYLKEQRNLNQDMCNTLCRILPFIEGDLKEELLLFLQDVLQKNTKLMLDSSSLALLMQVMETSSAATLQAAVASVGLVLKNNPALSITAEQFDILWKAIEHADSPLTERECVFAILKALENTKGFMVSKERFEFLLALLERDTAQYIGMSKPQKVLKETHDFLTLATGAAMAYNTELTDVFFARFEIPGIISHKDKFIAALTRAYVLNESLINPIIGFFKSAPPKVKEWIAEAIHGALNNNSKLTLTSEHLSVLLEARAKLGPTVSASIQIAIMKVIIQAMSRDTTLRQKLTAGELAVLIAALSGIPATLQQILAEVLSSDIPWKLMVAMVSKGIIAGANFEQITAICKKINAMPPPATADSIYKIFENLIQNDWIIQADLPYLNEALQILVNANSDHLIKSFFNGIAADIKKKGMRPNEISMVNFIDRAADVLQLSDLSEEKVIKLLVPKSMVDPKAEMTPIDELFREVTMVNFHEEPYAMYLYLKLRKELKEVVVGLSYGEFNDIINNNAEGPFKAVINRFILKEVRRAEEKLSDTDQDTIINLSIDLNDELLEMAKKKYAGNPKFAFTFRELKEFNIDFSRFYLQKGSLENVLEYFIVTAANIYGFLITDEDTLQMFVDILEKNIRTYHDFLKIAAVDSPLLRSANLRKVIENLIRYGTYEDLSSQVNEDEIKIVRATRAKIERAAQAQKPLILFTSDSSLDVVDKAMEALMRPGRNLLRLPMSQFTARRHFFGMYLPLSIPREDEIRYLLGKATDDDIKQALDRVLRLGHDANLIEEYFKRWGSEFSSDSVLRAAVSCALRYGDDWEKEMKWYDGILKLVRDEAIKKRGEQFFLLFENVEGMPDRVRVQFNPVLLENVVEVPELGISISLPANVHIVFTMHKDSEIKDSSFMDRPIRQYVPDPSYTDMMKYLKAETNVSEETAETLLDIYGQLKKTKSADVSGTLFFDIVQIAKAIYGVAQDLQCPEEEVIKRETYGYLSLKVMTKKSKESLAKCIYTTVALPKPPAITVKEGKIYFGDVALDISGDFRDFIAQHPSLSPEELIFAFTGFIISDTECWIFAQLARTLRYRHVAIQLEGPSGEGKTEIGKAFAKIIGYNLNHYTVNEDTNLSQFVGQITPDVYGRYYISKPRYLTSAKTPGNLHLMDEINTCQGLYYWLYPEIMARPMKYLPEFPLQDTETAELFRTLPIDQNNLWLFTVNPDTFQGREPLPRSIAANLVRFYMQIPSEEIPKVCRDLLAKGNKESAKTVDVGVLDQLVDSLSSIHNAFRSAVREDVFVSGQDITKRALVRTVEAFFVYLNEGSTVEEALSHALEDNYIFVWHNIGDIETARTITGKNYKYFVSSPSPIDVLRRKLLVSKRALFVFTNGANYQQETEDDIKKTLGSPTIIPISLSYFHNKRQLVGGLVTKESEAEELPADERLRQLQATMKIEFEMGVGIIPELIYTARLHPDTPYVAFLYNYMHLNPKVAPLLNEFFQTGILDLNGVLTESRVQELVMVFSQNQKLFQDSIQQYNRTARAKLSSDLEKLTDEEKMLLTQWFYSTLPENLRFIAFDSSGEKPNLSPAEVDRFSPVNISETITSDWVEQYVRKHLNVHMKALPADTKRTIIDYALSVYWLYKTEEEDSIYKHLRISRSDLDTFLSELGEALKKYPQKDPLSLIKEIGYYTLAIGLIPEYLGGIRCHRDMPEKLKSTVSDVVEAPFITDPKNALRYEVGSDGSVYLVVNELLWFKTGFKDLEDVEVIKDKFLAPTEESVRRYASMLIALKHNRSIILEGYQGGGKTSSIEDLSQRIKLPNYNGLMYEDIDIGEAVGRLTIQGKKVILTAAEKDSQGRFLIDFLNAYYRNPEAATGGIYNADEGAMGKNSQELLSLLQSVSQLEELYLGHFHPGLKLRLPRDPNFHLAITQNPSNATKGRSSIPYTIDSQAMKIWVDNRLSEEDCIRILEYYLKDVPQLPMELKYKIARLHRKFLYEHPARDELSPRQLIAFTQLLKKELEKPLKEQDLSRALFQGIMINYLSTVVSENEFNNLWAMIEEIFDGDSLSGELKERLKEWRGTLKVTRTNGTIDFGGIVLSAGNGNADLVPRHDDLRYSSGLDVGSTNKALRDFALALSLGRPVALLEEDGADVADLVKRFSLMSEWELYASDCHYEMTRMHLLESLLPLFDEMDDYGVKTEKISEGLKMALGFLAMHLVREDELERARREGTHANKILFFSYMDTIPERQRVMLHRLLAERNIALIDEKGERVVYVLPEWAHIVVSAPLEHKFSSPFINRFSRIAVRSLKDLSELRDIIKSRYPNVTKKELLWIRAIAVKMYQFDRSGVFNIRYGFSIKDIFEIAALIQREKQKDVDKKSFHPNPLYYCLKAFMLFYLAALEESDKVKFEQELMKDHWLKRFIFRDNQVSDADTDKIYQALKDEITVGLTTISFEEFEHPRIRVDAEEINRGIVLDNGITVIKVEGEIIIQTPGNIYSFKTQDIKDGKLKMLSPTMGVKLLDGKYLVVVCRLLSSIGGQDIPRDTSAKAYSLPPHETTSRSYIEYTNTIRQLMSALIKAFLRIQEPSGRIINPRVVLLNGESGTGKTTLLHSISDIWGIPFYQLNAYEDIRVSDITAELRLEEGKFKVGIKEFLARCGTINGKRVHLPQKQDANRKILLLDEANANPDVLFALMPLFRGERKFSVYFAGEVFEVELDSDVLVVLTFNPAEKYAGRYSIANELSFNAIKLWMPDPLKYNRTDRFNILKEIHRRGIDKVKKELSGQVKQVSFVVPSGVREIKTEPDKIRDISADMPELVSQDEIIDDIIEVEPEGEKTTPKKPRRSVKQKVVISYDKNAINNAISEYAKEQPDAQMPYFIEKILQPFLFALTHRDTEGINVDRLLDIAKKLGIRTEVEQLTALYKEKIIKMSALRRIVLSLRRTIAKGNYFCSMKCLIINKKPYIMITVKGKITQRLKAPDGLDSLLQQGSLEKKNWDEWKVLGNEPQVLVVDSSQGSILGYFEGEFAIALEKPSAEEALLAHVSEQEAIDWTAFHELGHLFQNVIKRRSLKRNIELYSTLFPLLFSSDALKYIEYDLVQRIRNVVAIGGLERARKDYYCQAAKAILNGFAIYMDEHYNSSYRYYMISNFDENFDVSDVTRIFEGIKHYMKQNDIRDAARTFFEEPEKYLSTVEAGKYRIKLAHGKGGLQIEEIQGDLEESPEFDIIDEEDVDEEIEMTEQDKNPDEGIIEEDEEKKRDTEIEDDFYTDAEGGLADKIKELLTISPHLVRDFLNIFAAPEQIVRTPAESGEEIDIILKIMGSLEPFIQVKRLKREGMLSCGITVDISGSVLGNSPLKNSFTQMSDFYTSLFYLAASINRDMEFSLGAIGDKHHLLLDFPDCRNKDSVEKGLGNLWHVPDRGGINTVSVMNGIRRKYATRKDKPNKLEIIFTDGGETSGVSFSELRKQLKALEAELGIDIVFIGIGEGAREVKGYNKFMYFEKTPTSKEMMDIIMKLCIEKASHGKLDDGDLFRLTGVVTQAITKEVLQTRVPYDRTL